MILIIYIQQHQTTITLVVMHCYMAITVLIRFTQISNSKDKMFHKDFYKEAFELQFNRKIKDTPTTDENVTTR